MCGGGGGGGLDSRECSALHSQLTSCVVVSLSRIGCDIIASLRARELDVHNRKEKGGTPTGPRAHRRHYAIKSKPITCCMPGNIIVMLCACAPHTVLCVRILQEKKKGMDIVSARVHNPHICGDPNQHILDGCTWYFCAKGEHREQQE